MKPAFGRWTTAATLRGIKLQQRDLAGSTVESKYPSQRPGGLQQNECQDQRRRASHSRFPVVAINKPNSPELDASTACRHRIAPPQVVNGLYERLFLIADHLQAPATPIAELMF